MPRYATVAATARFLDVSVKSVRNATYRHLFAAYRAPGHRALVFDLDEVAEAVTADAGARLRIGPRSPLYAGGKAEVRVLDHAVRVEA